MLLGRRENPIPRGGENAVLPMLLEQVQNASVKRERLARVNGFHFVFNLLDHGALKSQLAVNPIYVLPL